MMSEIMDKLINLYFMRNYPDWFDKIKYGIVRGDYINLGRRLNNSKEQHPELSKFINIFTFQITDKYILNYEEIDKIISLIGSNLEIIKIVENLYNLKLPLLRKLNKFLVKSENR